MGWFRIVSLLEHYKRQQHHASIARLIMMKFQSLLFYANSWKHKVCQASRIPNTSRGIIVFCESENFRYLQPESNFPTYRFSFDFLARERILESRKNAHDESGGDLA